MTGAVIAVVLIAIVDLMHFSQGWVQFGYRFSNDFAPFALLLLALALEAGRPAPAGRATCSSRISIADRRVGRGLGPPPRMVTLDRPHRDRRPDSSWPRSVAAFVALVAAVSTLLPGVAFWDTGELQAVGPLLGTAHPTGFPTWVVLGWLASVVLQPFGEPAFRMNLLNAICLAVAAALCAVLVHRLTGGAWLAFATGVVLAPTPIAWSIGTHADAHGLHLVLSALLLVLLVDWERLERADGGRRPGADRRLVASAVVFGLALGNHSLVILCGAPGSLLFVFAVAPGDPAPAAPRRRLPGRPRRDGRRGLPRAAAPGRPVPGAARLRAPRDVRRVLVRRPGPPVRRQPRSPRSPTWAESRDARAVRLRTSSACSSCSSRSGSSRRRSGGRATRS